VNPVKYHCEFRDSCINLKRRNFAVPFMLHSRETAMNEVIGVDFFFHVLYISPVINKRKLGETVLFHSVHVFQQSRQPRSRFFERALGFLRTVSDCM